jgi:hypothetical protein
LSDPKINLMVVDAEVTLLSGQPPFTPESFLMCGYNEDGEFFVLSSLENDVQIAFAIDRMWQILKERAKN